MKIGVIVLFIVIGLLTAYSMISGINNKQQEYNDYIEDARYNSQKGLPYVAYQSYVAAMNIKNEDEGVYREYMEQAKLLGDKFYDRAITSYPQYFPDSSQAYDELCQYYFDRQDFSEVIDTALGANSAGVATEKVQQLYYDCCYKFDLIKTGMEQAQSYLGGYALVKTDGKYGYVDSNGNFVLSPIYVDAAPLYDQSSASVNDGEECCVVNLSGFKIAKPSGPLDSISYQSSGLVRISKGGRYGFTNSSLNFSDDSFHFDYVTNFRNGVAAAKVDEKWALISDNGDNLTDYIYDDILIDEYETCINNGVVFAKSGDKYYMLDAKGEKITEQGFDNAYPFTSDQPAAVCIDGKWGFVFSDGTMCIEPEYDNAKSYSIGLAPIYVNGLWGYQDSNGVVRIAPQFDDCMPFSENGIAAVCNDDVWSYIKLLPYEN